MGYSTLKQEIPIGSLWFTQEQEHPEWYATSASWDSTRLDIGYMPQPNVIGQRDWLEASLLPVLFNGLAAILKSKSKAMAHELIAFVITPFVKFLARHWRIEEAYQIVSTVCEIVDKNFGPVLAEDSESAEDLGVAELVGTLPVEIYLSFINDLAKEPQKAMESRVKRIRWGDKRSLYHAGFEEYCLSNLEFLQPRLAFEKAIEGILVTPSWYIVELLFEEEANNFHSSVDKMLREPAVMYNQCCVQFLKKNRSWMAAVTVSRELEFLRKAQDRMAELKSASAKYFKPQSSNEKSSSPTHIEDWEPELEEHEIAMAGQIALMLLSLQKIPRPKDFANYPGQFLNELSLLSLKGLSKPSLSLFRTSFGGFFFGSFQRGGDLLPSQGSQATEWQISIATIPFMDLLDVCGYALLYAEMHGLPELWDVVVKMWNAHLANRDKQAIGQFFCAVIKLSDDPAHFSIALERKTKRRNRVRDDILRTIANSTDMRPSAVMRLFAGDSDSYSMRFDGVDIFMEFFFRRLQDVKCELGRNRAEFKASLENEEHTPGI